VTDPDAAPGITCDTPGKGDPLADSPGLEATDA
jgi:hypothetical protein